MNDGIIFNFIEFYIKVINWIYYRCIFLVYDVKIFDWFVEKNIFFLYYFN